MSHTPLSLALALSLSAFGCAPGIGDACIADQECAGVQVCDTTMPGGYCTVVDCAASGGSCPGDAVCVEFPRDPAPPISACMESCTSDKQCRKRDGYVCRDDPGGPKFCGLPPRASTDFTPGTLPPDASGDGSEAGSGEGSEAGSGEGSGD